MNAIDWSLKRKNREQFDYYRNLIDLRRSHPAFRMTNAGDIAKHIVFAEMKTPNLISYAIKDNANGDEWKEIRVVFNGSEKPQTVKAERRMDCGCGRRQARQERLGHDERRRCRGCSASRPYPCQVNSC